MKKSKLFVCLLGLLVLCNVLTGCSFNVSIDVSKPTRTVEIYIPDETKTDIVLVPIEVILDNSDDDKQTLVLEALKEYSLISEDTYIKGYTSVGWLSPKIKLNFSESLLDDFNNSGYDSKVLMRCIVNSFWYNFEPSTLEITIDGEAIKTTENTFDSVYTSPM